MLRLFCITAIILISATGFAQSGKRSRFDNEMQKSCQLIAMLSMNYKGTPVFGAGIIVGRRKDSLFIATAYHLVHYGNTQPDSIGVQLKTRPGTVLSATVLNPPGEKTMDLALLRVKGSIQESKCGLLFKQLSADVKRRGDEVLAVGNPNGVPWVIPIDADKIVQTNENEIVFQSPMISIGNSGGGLLDDEGHFIGMVTSDQAPYGRAIDIRAVLDQVKRWGYPVELGNAEKPFTSTSLHVAAKNGNAKEVKYSLENCADANALDNNYENALHIAVRGGHIEVVSVLLKAGIDKERPGQRLATPLKIAVQTGRMDMVNLLLKAGASPTDRLGFDYSLRPMATAIDSANFEMLNRLCAAGADINETDETDDGALYHAVRTKAKLSVIKSLLMAGADPNCSSEKDVRKSPLGSAADMQNIEVMQLLIEAGAKINAKDKDGHTPLWLALAGRDKEAVDWLRAHGAKE